MITINKSNKRPKDLTYKQLYAANQNHRTAVHKCLKVFSDMMQKASTNHDSDKFTAFNSMYAAIQEGGTAQNEWLLGHIYNSRHHDIGSVKDVTLVDVLELIADQVVIKAPRSEGIVIDPSVLMKAFENTVKLLVEQIEVKEK